MGNCVTLIIECAVNILWTFSVIGGVYFSPTMSTEGWGGDSLLTLANATQ